MSQQTVAQQPTFTDLVGHLTRFEGPPEQFLLHLLAVQCHVAGADGGAILRTSAKKQIEVLSVFPQPEPDQHPPSWLGRSVELAPRVLQKGDALVDHLAADGELYGSQASQSLIILPLPGGSGVRGCIGFVVNTVEPALINAARQRLELTTPLLSLYEMRLTLQQRRADMARLKQGIEVLAEVNESSRFKQAAFALCNQVASGWDAERVSLGFHKGRYIRVEGMSHTENLNRKMQLVQDIESAMEECFDQDVEVIYPAPDKATTVYRAATSLSNKHGPTAIVSLPLRYNQEPIGVLTVERGIDKPLTPEQIETLRLVCELCTSRVSDLYEHDKWFGAKAAAATRKGAAYLLGDRHTWAKLTVLGLVIAAAFLIFARGTDWAEGSVVIETTKLQIVPAPFDGYIESTAVEQNDQVKAGDELARLDDSDLRVEREVSRAEMMEYEKEKGIHLRKGEIAEAQIAQAQIDKAKARIELLDDRINKAVLRASLAGVVVRGDLEQRLGSPVSKGDVLFHIAPLDEMRAEIAVPEDRIGNVKIGQEGQLATDGYPGDYIPFVVERIDYVAEVDNQQNIYRVRAKLLLDNADKPRPVEHVLRPDMKGLAKIDTGKRSYAYLWTRAAINWIRMKLWI